MEPFLADPRPAAILQRLAEQWVQYGHTTLRLVSLTARHRVHLVSRLDDRLARRLGFHPVSDPSAVVDAWRRARGGDTVAVIAGQPVFPRGEAPTWVRTGAGRGSTLGLGVSMKDASKNTVMAPAVVAAVDNGAGRARGVVSRVLARSSGGSVTIFAFAAGQELSEHTAPFDALVHVVSGRLELTIGRKPVPADRGELVVMPAGVPHALRAAADTSMILTMLRDRGEG
jgi:quercetin dioxygenase-like cupin family protein